MRKLGLTSGNTSAQEITITSGTLSERFDLPAMRIGAVISTTGAARTLTLQIRNVLDNGWIDTELTATTTATDGVLWLADDLSPYSAGFGGHSLFRLKLSAADTVTVRFYGN